MILSGGPADGRRVHPMADGSVPWKLYIMRGTGGEWTGGEFVEYVERRTPWCLGVYIQPETPRTEHGLWVLTWRGWLAPMPEEN